MPDAIANEKPCAHARLHKLLAGQAPMQPESGWGWGVSLFLYIIFIGICGTKGFGRSEIGYRFNDLGLKSGKVFALF